MSAGDESAHNRNPKVPTAKFKEGDTVVFEGNKYKVELAGYVAHPELYIGGERRRSGWAYQLTPVDPETEETGGWVPEYRIRKCSQGSSHKSNKKVILTQEYEGLDGLYKIMVYEDMSYDLETPRHEVAEGKFDQLGFSHEAEYQEDDIEKWINSIGEMLISKHKPGPSHSSSNLNSPKISLDPAKTSETRQYGIIDLENIIFKMVRAVPLTKPEEEIVRKTVSKMK